MAHLLGYKLMGALSQCDACFMMKSKAKAVPKTSSSVCTKKGECMGLVGTVSFDEWFITYSHSEYFFLVRSS